MINIEQVVPLTERYNRPWMVGALDYKNSKRGLSGKEDHATKWFRDLNALSWSTPFFRHVDGKDHTHFFIDIDIKVPSKKVNLAYRKYPDRLRALKLEAGIEFFRQWQAQHSHYEFFWKISGTGLHAIQRIDRRMDRSRLVPIILHLFPPSSRLKVTISHPKNAIDVRPPRKGVVASPRLTDDGWCLDVKIDKNGRKIHVGESWVKLWEYKGVVFKIIIDLRFYYNETRVVRWTYSPYFNIPGRIYYSVPIRKWDIESVLKESVMEGLILTRYRIPDFSFKHMLDWEDTVDDELWIKRSAKRISESRADVSPYQINLYPVGAELPPRLAKTIREMSDVFTQSIEFVPPCMKVFFERAQGKGGAHWPRFQIGRYLRAFDYTVTQIANWYRCEINDNDDNLPENQNQLLYYLPYVLGEETNPHKVASCGVLQDPGSNFYVCDEEMQKMCLRNHPLAKRPRPEKKLPTGMVKPKPQFAGERAHSYWTKIKKLLRDAFEKDKNLVVWKATRAGVTTSMIRIAVEKGKKLLVVVPTNRIGETTFPEALKIVKDDIGRDVNGAILASNRRGCLLLNFVEHGLEEMKLHSPEWGDDGIAWIKLKYHAKGECTKCAHREAMITTPIINKDGNPLPLYRSEILDSQRKIGYCAYMTFRTNIREFDVVFVTYSKLYSLMMNLNTDNEELRDDLFGYFDIILLDEVSTFANKSPLDMQLLRHPYHLRKMTEVAQIDIFSKLREEMRQLANFTTTSISHDIIDYCNRFIASFEFLKMREWNPDSAYIGCVGDYYGDPEMENFGHPLHYYDREKLRQNYNKIHGVFDNYARVENRLLRTMEDVLLILCEESWVVVNTPSPTRALDLRFVASPKTAQVKAFIRQFAAPGNNKSVFATDACMPEVNLSDFFQIDFEDFVVGDPRKTNEHQLIIADTRNVGVIRFMAPKTCGEEKCSYYNSGCNLKHTFYGENPDNNWKVEQRNLSAYYNGRCYRYQIEFLKETNAIAQMYKPENVMVVLPNIEIYLWFLKRVKWGAVPRGILIIYYRSDKTLGVPCERRIMIALGMPYTPIGSHLWLAYYYHQDRLLRKTPLLELEKILRVNACKQSFWQTIGRAKSPDSSERSVVITWGISATGLEVLFDFNRDYMKGAMPHIFIPKSRGHDDRVTYQIGRFWRTYGAIPEPALLRLVQVTRSARWAGEWINHTDLRNYGGIEQGEVERMAALYDEEMFGHFGVEVEQKTWGARTTIKVRSTTYDEENLFIDD